MLELGKMAKDGIATTAEVVNTVKPLRRFTTTCGSIASGGENHTRSFREILLLLIHLK